MTVRARESVTIGGMYDIRPRRVQYQTRNIVHQTLRGLHVLLSGVQVSV